MGLFNTILEKIGLGKAHAAPGSTAPTTPPEASTGGAAAPVTPVMDQVDVAAKLDGMAANNPEKLNWRTSIVDLLKLLGLDSSLTARKELASELGCPQDKMADSAQMNMWLHKTVLNRLAENGGNVPADLLD
ncbi:oxidoreductase [Pseudomonas sp. BAY1663]|uniref:DUF3597 domain-containing protein n=1 Tax=Pseudomonas sp. BAY1663 TaxID=1439940 RepID=UPI00042DE742|nr:DUF3597 domain-containing protein [Pseudomonas sp. BAY1663]EXF44569.1 oxidoreductase [Pseudomonas sp. BAY1663]